MNAQVRKSNVNDFQFLVSLETNSFPVFQRSTNKSLKNSIHSNFQENIIIETKGKNSTPIGAMVLYKYGKSLRIYSIAILTEFQNKGYGDYLLSYAMEFAKQNQYEKILIEVSESNQKLINWYKNKGFQAIAKIEDYYEKGQSAIKMAYQTDTLSSSINNHNIIVINQPTKWNFTNVNAKVISVKEYINNPVYQSSSVFRVFNLCSSYKYQSYGYYVSLLASARGHRAIPSSITIRDFRILNVIHSVAFDIEELINKTLFKVKDSLFSLNVYFGHTNVKGFASLANKLYQLFEVPLFKVVFIKTDKWIIKKIEVLTYNKVPDTDVVYVNDFAKLYFNKKRFVNTKLINYKYDIAILVNPQESTPPSCSKALQNFKSAANRKGMYVEFITKSDFNKINEFDALFIRETTSVNNHTYEFSRMAYAEGLVVIDDPWSILKCSNKIYQNELFKKHKILTPNTTIFTKNMFSKDVLNEMNYPLVLKQPDSAFSLGITKVENKYETIAALNNLFKKSDMIVCQEFLYSDFDWRIGIIDNTPLFACKYYMSKGHWQIYNWEGIEEDNTGDSETMSISMVPKNVLQTALKASALIGDGLYGVDLKLIDDKVYVVEVNDNPNIDAGIEDLELKEKLYDLIMESIFQRIEIAKNVQKIDFR
ncbi:MAG: GNAT family N-acetyltransferase [Bacteroidales bacterium]|nr:GNAT family N-acetyltransferase [Bacteroidales bacterium]